MANRSTKPRSKSPARLVIRASAGSGKTYALSSRYLELVLRGVPPDRILATTFTRKAAGEILQRVLMRLARAVTDPQQREQLAKDAHAPGLSSDRCAELLAELAKNLHRTRVGTLDSYFGQLARSFSLELGLPAGWTYAEQHQEQRLIQRAIQELLESDVDAAVTLMHRLAKGDSKRSVAEEIRDTVEDLYRIWRDCSENAWCGLKPPPPLESNALNEAIEALENYSIPHDTLERAKQSDLQKALVRDWEKFLTKGLAAKVAGGETTYSRIPIPPELIELYEPLVHHAQAILLRQLADQTEATGELLKAFHQCIAPWKERFRCQTFDDITQRLAALQWQVEAVAHRMDTTIEHLLLDEFQDTAPSQWSILRPIAEQICGCDDGPSLFCVGDVKQAIYGWRGGDARIFDCLEQDLPQIEKQNLDVSYRSSPAVIQGVNTLFERLGQTELAQDFGPMFQRWLDAFPPHTAVRRELEGYFCLETGPAGDDVRDAKAALLPYAAQRIQQLCAAHPECSVGVLLRSRQQLTQMMYHLRQLDVPASQEGGNPLDDSAAVHLVFALLRLIDHPSDWVSRFHLATSPWGPLLSLTDYRDDTAAYDLAWRMRQQLADWGYGDTIATWIEQLAPMGSAHDRRRLEQLRSLAYRYDSDATLRTRDFIQFVQQSEVTDARHAQVRLLTIHKAKGLQFDIVVLPELDSRIQGVDTVVFERAESGRTIPAVLRYANKVLLDLLPERFRQMHLAHRDRIFQEALCVLYVAVTRAVHAAHLLIAAKDKRKEKACYSTWLRQALAPDKECLPETVLYSCGSPDWRPPATSAAALSAPSARSGSGSSAPIRLAPRSSAALEPTSPSAREGAGTVDLGRLIAWDGRQARRRGELLHRWFEQIVWLDDGGVDDERLKRCARQWNIPEGELLECLSYFRERLAVPALQNVLVRKLYRQPDRLPFPAELVKQLCGSSVELDVRNEVPVAASDDDQLLSGIIDRLLLFRRNEEIVAAEIIDYKTDRVDADDVDAWQAKVDFYAPQLQAYRSAVAQMLRIAPERIAARLVFVHPGRQARV